MGRGLMALPTQIRLPLAVDPNTGDFATIEQGSPPELAQRVTVLVTTPLGWFDSAPGFGLYDQAFLEGGADIGEIEQQIATYVPDADTILTEDLSMMNQALDVLSVQVDAK